VWREDGDDELVACGCKFGGGEDFQKLSECSQGAVCKGGSY